jgi:uncharacterized membrane-anchored protein
MYDIIYNFLAEFHGNAAAVGFDVFMKVSVYVFLSLLLVVILGAIVYFVVYIKRVIWLIPHAFIRITRTRTRWQGGKTPWKKSKSRGQNDELSD